MENDWRALKIMTKALADVARLTIVYHLARLDEVTVTKLTEMLSISQPLVSWHLRRLRRAGLVHTRRVGRQVYCSLNRERFQYCLSLLDRLADPAIVLEEPPIGTALIEADPALED